MQSVAEIPFIAGHVALDFVNTAEGRGHPDAGEALRTPGDLRLWGERRGVIAHVAHVAHGAHGADDAHGADADAGLREFPAALQARELLYRLFLGQARGDRAAAADLSQLEGLASGAYQAARLNQEADGRLSWAWDRSQLATVRHVAVVSALELLSQSPGDRLKQCPGDHCGWFFLDATKRGNRRWCSMSECGQDAKTARRRAAPRRSPGTASGHQSRAR